MKRYIAPLLLLGLVACQKSPQDTPPSTQAPSVSTQGNMPTAPVAAQAPGNINAPITSDQDNVKDWLAANAAKKGLKVDWKLKGHYYLPESEKELFSRLDILQILEMLTQKMGLQNFMKYSQWQFKNPGKPFPYPIGVFVAQCDKTLLFVEMNNQKDFSAELTQGSLKNCHVPKYEAPNVPVPAEWQKEEAASAVAK